MKAATSNLDHRTPLLPEITNELRHWREIFDGKGFALLSPQSGKHNPHSWRSTFSTLALESRFALDVVELVLDHAHDNEVPRAYDRNERFDDRIKLFNWWGENNFPRLNTVPQR